MRSLVIVPTYNEAENVLRLTEEIFRQPLPPGQSLDVLVVDDASPDGTGDIVARAAESDERIHLLRREGKLGLGTAYLAGFRYGLDGGFDRVLTMDCDFSHHPRYLPDLLAGMDDHDMMIGSRYIPGGGVADWPLHRRALSRFANVYTRVLLRVPVHDCTGGFRCYASEVLEAVDPFSIRSSGYSFLEEMVFRVHRARFRIGETPIVFEDRERGVSKINKSEIWRAAWHVLRASVARR